MAIAQTKTKIKNAINNLDKTRVINPKGRRKRKIFLMI